MEDPIRVEELHKRLSETNQDDSEENKLLKKKRRSKVQVAPSLDLVPELAHFKTKPPCSTVVKKVQRPFTGRSCQNCCPNSRELFYNPDMPNMGISNILSIPRLNFWPRCFCHLQWVLTAGQNYQYPSANQLTESTLENKRVQLAIHQSAMCDSNDRSDDDVYQTASHRHHGRARHILRKMSTAMSNVVLRITGWVLLKLFSFFLYGVHIHQGQLEMVKQASKRNVPLIILPLHRSHMDYLVMTFILYSNDIRAPYIAAGENLNIPFFGWAFRHLGAFFIKRKLDKIVGKKDLVYRSTLHTYMEQILRNNQNMEFFMEGGRSRSGKALSPKGGLLSVIVDAYMDGSIPDAYLVPASYSYERILDGNFNNEQMGLSKSKESFFGAFSALFSMMNKEYGYVRVNFSQPFSLKEYLDTAPSPKNLHSSEISLKPRLVKTVSDNSLYGTDVVLEDQKHLIRAIAEHVVCDAVQVHSLMSTNLVAFLLLNKHRRGTTMNQLILDCEWLKKEILFRGRDVGFSGNMSFVIRHSIKILGPNLMARHTKSLEPDVVPPPSDERKMLGDSREVVIPTVDVPEIFDLMYYSNAVISVFLMESVIANCVVSLCGQELTQSLNNPSGTVPIYRSKIIDKAEELCDLLQFEFIFAKPCESIASKIGEAIDKFLESELLKYPKTTSGTRSDSQWARRVASSTLWSGEDNDGYSEYIYDMNDQLEVCTDTEGIEKIYFLQRILGPLIEGYWLSSCNLVRLLDQDMSEAEFSNLVNTYAKERVTKGLATYAESCAMDTLRNSWRLFAHWKVITSYHDNQVKIIQLAEQYRKEEELGKFIDKIEAFRN